MPENMSRPWSSVPSHIGIACHGFVPGGRRPSMMSRCARSYGFCGAMTEAKIAASAISDRGRKAQQGQFRAANSATKRRNGSFLTRRCGGRKRGSAHAGPTLRATARASPASWPGLTRPSIAAPTERSCATPNSRTVNQPGCKLARCGVAGSTSLQTNHSAYCTSGSQTTCCAGPEHRQRATESFTKRYYVTRLVYSEWHEDIRYVIQRETSIKRWPRAWKLDLITEQNPRWEDRYTQLA